MASAKGIRGVCVSVAIVLGACSAPDEVTPARVAQTALVQPLDSAFVPLSCGAGPATDPAGDTNGGATGGRDVVGDLSFPAVLRATQGSTVYLRMRVDSSPEQAAGNLASFGWGYEFDTDGDVTSYEKVFIANGVGTDQMDWWDNTTQGTPDDPADTPEVLLETYAPAVDFWAVTPADSNFGGTPDFFFTIAIQQSDLQTYGISFACTAQIWAGSSNSGQRIDNDLACHDGEAAPYSLSAAWVGQPPDPLGVLDYDADGLNTAEEIAAASDACDPDSDDDGLRDGLDGANDTDGDGAADAVDPDSDGDGLSDGLEAGVTIWTAQPGTDIGSPSFRSDADPASVTDPDDPDSDDDGLLDGEEDANADGSVAREESDPADFDTDDGGVGDGVEADRGTSPLDPRDDYHVAGGGGCSVASSRGAPLAPLLLLVLAFAVARGRRRAVPLAMLLLCAPAVASGQTVPTDRDFDAQRFQPSPGFHDVLGVSSPRTADNLSWAVLVWGNHASRPLRLVDPSDDSTERAIIANHTAIDLAGTIGLLDRYEVGFSVPMTVARAGDAGLVGPPGAQGTPSRAGLSDLRIVPKVRLLERGDFALGAAAPLTLPTSAKDEFLGTRTPTLSPRGTGEWRTPRLRLLANAGMALREEREFVNLRVGNAFTFGVAADVPWRVLKNDVSLVASIEGETAMRSPGMEETPVEAALGVTWYTFDGFLVSVGGSRGMTLGYGAPEWRAFATVGYAPSRRRPRNTPAGPPAAIGVIDGRLTLSHKIDFASDLDRIEEHSFPVLEEAAAFLRKNRWIRKVRIEGHTDNQGGEQYNLNLSQLRAIAITRFLVGNGVEPDVLEAKGFGLSQPVDTNETEEGRAKNRRVEFVILEIDRETAPTWAKEAFPTK